MLWVFLLEGWLHIIAYLYCYIFQGFSKGSCTKSNVHSENSDAEEEYCDDAESDISDVEERGYCDDDKSSPEIRMRVNHVVMHKIKDMYNDSDKVSIILSHKCLSW